MNLPPMKPRWIALAVSLMATTLFPYLAKAQELTPVRQLGQGGTAANPYEIAADGQVRRQQRERAPNSISAAAQPGAPTGEAGAWWEGMSSLAEQSMKESLWKFRFGLTVAYEYDDNFTMALVDERETSIISASPYGVLSLGEPGSGVDFQIRYAPEFRWFSDSSIDEIVNHNLSASLGLNGGHSHLTVDTSYTHNEGGNIETGSLVTSDVFTIGSLASYDISSKTTIGGTVRYTISEYDAFNSHDIFTARLFADYAVTPKTRLGLSIGYDHWEQEKNPASDAFNASLRATWAATDKISVNGTIGGEHREFDGGESFTTPVGDLGITYRISDKASLRLSGYRRATPSIGTVGTIFYSTGVALSGSVHATDRIGFTLTTGLENAKYEATTGPAINREDDYLFIRPSISYSINSHLSMSFFYQFSTNSSNVAASEFDRNQVGISLTLAY